MISSGCCRKIWKLVKSYRSASLTSGSNHQPIVPAGSPGSVIQVPYPGAPGKFINVNVPAKARPGQAMLVPVPDLSQAVSAGVAAPPAAPAAKEKKAGWSTGAKVAAGGAALAGVAGAAVGGAILGEHIAEHR